MRLLINRYHIIVVSYMHKAKLDVPQERIRVRDDDLGNTYAEVFARLKQQGFVLAYENSFPRWDIIDDVKRAEDDYVLNEEVAPYILYVFQSTRDTNSSASVEVATFYVGNEDTNRRH